MGRPTKTYPSFKWWFYYQCNLSKHILCVGSSPILLCEFERGTKIDFIPSYERLKKNNNLLKESGYDVVIFTSVDMVAHCGNDGLGLIMDTVEQCKTVVLLNYGHGLAEVDRLEEEVVQKAKQLGYSLASFTGYPSQKRLQDAGIEKIIFIEKHAEDLTIPNDKPSLFRELPTN